MKKNIDNKGEITTQQIVLLILLLISFAVILFFIFRFNPANETDKEICHNSVVLKGSALPDSAVPLKCSRTYVCLSKDGSCEKMTGPEIIKVKSEEEIYAALAKEMADCWWMFGEGKISYVDSAIAEKNYCSICTQFVLDDSVKDIEGVGEEISQDKLYEYLSKTTVPEGEETYTSYLLGTNDVDRLKRDLSRNAGTEVSFGTIEIGKQYFVVMGITSEVNTLGWIIRGGTVGAVAAVTFASGGFVVVAVGTVIGGAAGGVGAEKLSDLISPKIGAITIEGEGIKNKFMVPTIQEASSEDFKLLNCEEILTST